MRKWRSAICVLLLALLIPAAILAGRRLPLDTRPLVAKKYGGWSGVLRLWVYEGWPTGTGSAFSWLNRCITAYERAHPGVYVQPEAVDPTAVAALAGGTLYPPDMLLIPPGLLDATDLLEPLTLDLPLRPALAACGRVGETAYAAPVLAGGYLWAFNAGMIDAIPGSWRESGAAVAAPPDEPWRHWGAALLALCSARYSRSETPRPREAAPPEVELGLPDIGAAPSPAPAVPPETGTLNCALPEGFAPSADAWRDFINGQAAAIPVTQREIRRLEALADQGHGMDWRLAASGSGAFTDQLMCLGIVKPVEGSEAAGAKRALCEAFALHLLSDDCQGALASVGAFSVTDALSGYAPGDPLLAMEAALRDSGLAAPNCFDARWRMDAGIIVRKFIDGSAAPADLWRQLSERLGEKSEH